MERYPVFCNTPFCVGSGEVCVVTIEAMNTEINGYLAVFESSIEHLVVAQPGQSYDTHKALTFLNYSPMQCMVEAYTQVATCVMYMMRGENTVCLRRDLKLEPNEYQHMRDVLRVAPPGCFRYIIGIRGKVQLAYRGLLITYKVDAEEMHFTMRYQNLSSATIIVPAGTLVAYVRLVSDKLFRLIKYGEDIPLSITYILHNRIALRHENGEHLVYSEHNMYLPANSHFYVKYDCFYKVPFRQKNDYTLVVADLGAEPHLFRVKMGEWEKDRDLHLAIVNCNGYGVRLPRGVPLAKIVAMRRIRRSKRPVLAALSMGVASSKPYVWVPTKCTLEQPLGHHTTIYVEDRLDEQSCAMLHQNDTPPHRWVKRSDVRRLFEEYHSTKGCDDDLVLVLRLSVYKTGAAVLRNAIIAYASVRFKTFLHVPHLSRYAEPACLEYDDLEELRPPEAPYAQLLSDEVVDLAHYTPGEVAEPCSAPDLPPRDEPHRRYAAQEAEPFAHQERYNAHRAEPFRQDRERYSARNAEHFAQSPRKRYAPQETEPLRAQHEEPDIEALRKDTAERIRALRNTVLGEAHTKTTGLICAHCHNPVERRAPRNENAEHTVPSDTASRPVTPAPQPGEPVTRSQSPATRPELRMLPRPLAVPAAYPHRDNAIPKPRRVVIDLRAQPSSPGIQTPASADGGRTPPPSCDAATSGIAAEPGACARAIADAASGDSADEQFVLAPQPSGDGGGDAGGVGDAGEAVEGGVAAQAEAPHGADGQEAETGDAMKPRRRRNRSKRTRRVDVSPPTPGLLGVVYRVLESLLPAQ